MSLRSTTIMKTIYISFVNFHERMDGIRIISYRCIAWHMTSTQHACLRSIVGRYSGSSYANLELLDRQCSFVMDRVQGFTVTYLQSLLEQEHSRLSLICSHEPAFNARRAHYFFNVYHFI